MQPHLGEASIGESLFDPEQRNVAKQCNRAKISALLIALGRVLDIFLLTDNIACIQEWVH